MATHKVSILNGNSIPDTSGDVFIEPYTVKATNDQWGGLVLIFNDTSTRIGMRGFFQVPDNYVNNANIEIVWTATATTGDVEWDFDYRAVSGDDAESLDQTGTQESVNGNDAAPTAINNRLVFSVSLTDGNFVAGDTVEFELFRDGTDAGDTMTADAIVFSASFEYQD